MRAPAPPGGLQSGLRRGGTAMSRKPVMAVARLFAEVDRLYLDAGQPSVRKIALAAGRGVISYSTVHAVLRGPRVPRWRNFEIVVALWVSGNSARTFGNSARAREVT